MTVTRSKTGKTPGKPDTFPGMVETPGRQRRSRKSTFPDNHSDDSPTPTPPTIQVLRDPEVIVDPRAHDADLLNDTIHLNGNGHFNGNAHLNGKAHKTAQSAPASSRKHTSKDPRIDYSGEFEFGGSWGVSAMMIGFPLLMWYMWIGATYYNGHLPLPQHGQSLTDFLKHMAHLVYEGAFPHARVWMIYWTFLVVQGVFYLYMPGVYSTGKPLPHEGGKQLVYYCSGVWSFYTSIAIALVLHVTGVFKLYTLMDEFGPLMSIAIISGFLVSIVAYLSALYRGAEHRMSGYPIYDFFMGAELNPRMFGWLDLKMFFEIRLPWFILFFISLGAAARQWEQLGYVSGEVGFVLMAHFLYANACCKGEEMITTTWDMYYEKWGFMLIFWNMAGVPLSYCHCTIYLANHHPSIYHWNRFALAALYISYIFAYWVWDTANSQKNLFRAEERGTARDRKSFPQLPWKRVKNPKVIKTESGDSILCDGWYAKARKIHYTCDAYFALTWGLITGFNSPFPWFYPVFFSTMIVHRAWRDIQRCREKYGDAWREYERRVPWLFIPGLI